MKHTRYTVSCHPFKMFQHNVGPCTGEEFGITPISHQYARLSHIANVVFVSGGIHINSHIFIRRSSYVDTEPMSPPLYWSTIPRKSEPPLIPTNDLVVEHVRSHSNGRSFKRVIKYNRCIYYSNDLNTGISIAVCVSVSLSLERVSGGLCIVDFLPNIIYLSKIRRGV